MSIVKSLFGRLDLALRRNGTLAELMLRLAEMHGDNIFVTEETDLGATRTLTYEQAADQVTSWSVVIRARSTVGVPVVIATPNGIDQFLLCLAVSAAGGLPAPVNPQMTDAEIEHVIADSGAKLVIRDVSELETGPGSRSARQVPAKSAALVSLPDAGDVAALFYTSGTTGSPKGAALTHRGLVGQMSMAAAWPFVLRDDEIVMALPVAHIMGFIAVMGAAIAGIPIYFMQKFSPIRVLQAIEYRRSSAFIGVPSMYRTLYEVGASERDLRSIRVWISGADVMPSDLARKFKAMGASASLPGVGSIGEAAFIEGYGMVEVGGNVATKVSPPMLPLGLGDSLGLSMPGWRLKVVNEAGDKLLPGQVGELMLKGPGVLKGYWGDEDASRSALTDDGWLRTGDLVRSGPFNSVMFQGRAKAVIKSGGYSVYPLEVEEALEGHPDVLEAAVIGLPDTKLGEVPVAAVMLHSGRVTTAPDLELWAAVRLSPYKAPRQILIVDELPRTGTRKVQKDMLLPLFDGHRHE
ncbi:MAG: class I adenylate-forming enzyme family protein [Microthrixaceae bacterium]